MLVKSGYNTIHGLHVDAWNPAMRPVFNYTLLPWCENYSRGASRSPVGATGKNLGSWATKIAVRRHFLQLFLETQHDKNIHKTYIKHIYVYIIMECYCILLVVSIIMPYFQTKPLYWCFENSGGNLIHCCFGHIAILRNRCVTSVTQLLEDDYMTFEMFNWVLLMNCRL